MQRSSLYLLRACVQAAADALEASTPPAETDGAVVHCLLHDHAGAGVASRSLACLLPVKEAACPSYGTARATGSRDLSDRRSQCLCGACECECECERNHSFIHSFVAPVENEVLACFIIITSSCRRSRFGMHPQMQ